MWRSFKNADPAIKAAIIGGIFLLIGAFITGFFQLIKPQQTFSPPTPSATKVRISTPTSTPFLGPALVQHPPLKSDDANQDIVPFKLPVKAGDLIIVAITQWIGEVSVVTDNRHDTYSLIKKAIATPHTSQDAEDHKDHDYAQLYYAKNVTGGTTSVTVNFTATGDTNVGIYEFSGFDKIAPLDTKAVLSKTGTSQSPDGGILNTTVDNELCFVVGVDDDGKNRPPRQGNQYSLLEDHRDNASDYERFYTEFLIAPQGSYQADFSIATPSHWAVVGAAFKP